MRNTQLLLVFLFFIIIIINSAAAGADVDAFACGSASQNYPFCRSASSTADRVKDLIGRLTLQEKVRLLVNNAAAVPRLGIKGYEWWSEALHGVSDVGPGTKFGGDFPGATSFPQVITTAATFNASLWEEIGKVVSDEGRAMYNGGAAGLTYWSPNVNIFRDPRWGRGQETPGEDPVVAAKYATSYVRGLQGNTGGEERLKVAACCKHHTAYDLDNWKGVDRFHFNAKVSAQDMKDTYSVPFRSCVKEGKVASVMCSYNQVNGVPTCADPHLLRHTIRHSWSLQGYIVSDCDSVAVFFDTQHYTRTPEEAAAAAIKAGLDLNCGPFLAEHTEGAVEKGVLNESDVDGALSNTLAVQMRLGMFDSDSDSDSQPHSKLGPRDVCTPKHQHLALHAARQGIVLLKNHRATLPLSPQPLTSVALIGPNSNATATMIGNYAGVPCKYTSPLQGIGKYARTIFHNEGCSGGVACDHLFGNGEAIEAAGKADATILVMGLDQSMEAEFLDRVGLLLPGRQQELITKVASASKGPTILVLMSGGPIDVSFAQNDDRIAAILWAGYPGQAGGAAIADVLFGAHNPGGRLPMTWYPESYLENLPMTTMDMRANASAKYPGRTYRFYKGEVVYPFGHGLSYTTFKNTILKAPKLLRIPSSALPSKKFVRVADAHCRNLTLRVHVEVENTGSMDGTHTLLMYTSPPPATHDWAPQKQLLAFQSLYIPAGGKKRLQLTARVCKHLSVVDGGGVRRIPVGEHRLHIGDANHLVSLSHLISS